MSYIEAENISKAYGEKVLFSQTSLTVGAGEKVALVAANGTGKTSMLDILAGKDSPDSGVVRLIGGARVAYLPQEPALDPQKSIYEEALHGSGELIDTVKAYAKAIESKDQKAIENAGQRMEAIGAWSFEAQVKQVLSRLGLKDYGKQIKHLSGGERKRVALAQALIRESELLILDEPTNHLDLAMIEWLEDYMNTSKKALLMVTHDRYFLDRVCNTILELDQGQLYRYNGNYSYFLEKREERLELQNASVQKARNLMRKELDWVRRMPKARGTKAKYRVDAFHELKEQARKETVEQDIRIMVKTERMGTKAINLHNVGKSYDGRRLIDSFTYKFSKGEKVGIAGPNGSGKTTLLNIMAGMTEPGTGKISTGETVKIGYYQQDGIRFDEGDRVIEALRKVAEVVQLEKGKKITARQFLTHFLFPPKVQDQRIATLSGGEKRRLYLCTVLMQNPNFLLLDEPTNDLDIYTLNILEDYLMHFKGCVAVVSHDRYFMDKLADHMFVFREGGQVKDYPGNYSQYRAAEEEEERRKNLARKPAPAENSGKETAKTGRYEKRFSYKEKLEYERLGEEIEQLENEKQALSDKLSSGQMDADELQKASERISWLMEEIDKKTDRWLELSEKA